MAETSKFAESCTQQVQSLMKPEHEEHEENCTKAHHIQTVQNMRKRQS